MDRFGCKLGTAEERNSDSEDRSKGNTQVGRTERRRNSSWEILEGGEYTGQDGVWWGSGEERANGIQGICMEIMSEFSKTDRRHQTMHAGGAMKPKQDK